MRGRSRRRGPGAADPAAEGFLDEPVLAELVNRLCGKSWWPPPGVSSDICGPRRQPRLGSAVSAAISLAKVGVRDLDRSFARHCAWRDGQTGSAHITG